jgi:hypothetical protein
MEGRRTSIVYRNSKFRKSHMPSFQGVEILAKSFLDIKNTLQLKGLLSLNSDDCNSSG